MTDVYSCFRFKLTALKKGTLEVYWVFFIKHKKNVLASKGSKSNPQYVSAKYQAINKMNTVYSMTFNHVTLEEAWCNFWSKICNFQSFELNLLTPPRLLKQQWFLIPKLVISSRLCDPLSWTRKQCFIDEPEQIPSTIFMLMFFFFSMDGGELFSHIQDRRNHAFTERGKEIV